MDNRIKSIKEQKAKTKAEEAWILLMFFCLFVHIFTDRISFHKKIKR